MNTYVKEAFTALRQHIVLALLALMLIVAAIITYGYASTTGDGFRSVELNLTELSPNGTAGGFAVPASGASQPTGLRHSCAPSGASVTLSWNPSSSADAGDAREFADSAFPFALSIAHAGGGGAPPPPPPPSHSAHSVTYNVQITALPWNGLAGGTNSWSGISGTQMPVDITPGRPYNWSIQACGGGSCSGWQSSSFSCTPPPPPPNVDLKVRNDTDNPGGSYTDTIGVIDPIDQISLQWTSNGTSCSASTNPTGGNFSTNGQTNGTDTDVVEPFAGQNRTYTVTCVNGISAPRSDSVTVSANIGLPPIVIALPGFVRQGEETTLRWNLTTNVPATCSLMGPGVNMPALATSIGEVSVPVTGESTFTLTCPGGTDEVRIEVLPVVQET